MFNCILSYLFSNNTKNTKDYILFRNKNNDKIKESKIFPLDGNEYNHYKCSICFDSLIFNRALFITECRHHFHKSCLDNWILSKNNNNKLPNCPICRQVININKLQFIVT